jgi:hypothetical protein
LREQLADEERVEDMALPDTVTFAGANEATLNTGSLEEIGIGANSPLLFRKVAGYQLVERWFHVKPDRLGREDNDETAWIFALRL